MQTRNRSPEHRWVLKSSRSIESARLDDFQRENIAGLAITPEGRFLAYNVRFALEFVRRVAE
ncbi:hypothetical protein C0Z16_28300 [Paraburkholderia rhynchosiae]|uniref:Uncharacterized protein n=1 Tax=Paraburkholderia rhynchosiae TaxID=487049 RepID=A0ABX4UYU0_9BURK|nr:hypothetical protein C0Z16_28300 [Paraburkholderia rhynchosiae]